MTEHSKQSLFGRDWQWLIFFWIAVTAYNLFKPFHIDDTAHLEIARWIAGHPFHPMSGLLNWAGSDEPIYQTNQPHLFFYFMALWGSLFGYSEPAMHSLQAMAAACCIFLTYRIARTLVPTAAIFVTALLVGGPAFIVEQNMMVDIPLLAAWLGFFYFLICGYDATNQTRRFIAVGSFLSIAVLIKYSSLVLLFIVCLSILIERRREQIWALVIPLLVVTLWCVFNFLDYGGIHILGRSSGNHGVLRPIEFAISWTVAVGSLSPIGVIALIGRWPQRAATIIFIVAFSLISIASLAAIGWLPGKLTNFLMWVAFLANGLVIASTYRSVLLRHIWPKCRPQDPTAISELYLLLWIIGTSAFYILLAPFMAARHVLLILPAVTILFAMEKGAYINPKSKSFALALTVIIAAGLCISDWRFADFYRTEAQRLAKMPGLTGRIWFTGHWGWQWYATKYGLREVDVLSSEPRTGDLLAVADAAPESLSRPPSMRLLRTDVETEPLLNLFCTGATARFYSFGIFQAPWSISRSCSHQVSIYTIEGDL